MDSFALEVLEAVVKAGRAAQRNAQGKRRRDSLSIKEAVYMLLPDAYDRVSDGGRYHANARQLMYEMRPDILRIRGIPQFSDNTVTQKCIPDFRDDYPALTADWKIAYDARGTLHEPHTGRTVALGRMAIGSYTSRRITYQRAVDASATIDASELLALRVPDQRLAHEDHRQEVWWCFSIATTSGWDGLDAIARVSGLKPGHRRVNDAPYHFAQMNRRYWEAKMS